MGIPANIQKSLRMKPEVTKIFEDLEAWHDHCRFNLLDFNPAHLYRSKEYKDWARNNKKKDRKDKGE